MEATILNIFRRKFPNMDQPARNEEILFFLDRSLNSQFDRAIYGELCENAVEQFGVLSPSSFAKTYAAALDVLTQNQGRIASDIASIDGQVAKLSEHSGPLTRVELTNIFQQPKSLRSVPKFIFSSGYEISNYYSGFVTFLSDAETLMTQKVFPSDSLGGPAPTDFSLTDGFNSLRLADNSSLSFDARLTASRTQEAINFYEQEKADKQQKAVRIANDREMLHRLVSLPAPVVERPVAARMDSAVMMTVAAAAALTCLSMFLCTERAAFPGVCVGLYVLANILILKNFTFFTLLKVAFVSLVGIFIAVLWLIIHLGRYRKKRFEWEDRKLQWWVFTLTFLEILLFAVVLLTAFLMSKQKRDWFLGNNVPGLHEADAEYILLNPEMANRVNLNRDIEIN